MPNNNNNDNNVVRFRDIAGALAKRLPQLPQVIWNRHKLMSAQPSQRGSTGYYLQRQATQTPSALFLQFEQQRYSYAEFNAWVNRLAHCLTAQGVKRGDCVAVMFENSPDLLACTFAINKIGAIAGLINHKQSGEVLKHSFATIKPRLIITDFHCYRAITAIQEQLTVELGIYGCGTGEWPADYIELNQLSSDYSEENPSVTAEILLAENCYYVFTSGTTGLPKAAAVTHLKWYKAGLAFGKMALSLKPKDIQYCALPLYHNTGLSACISSVIQVGASVALARHFSASKFWDDIRRFNATGFVYVGELCRYLLAAPARPDDREHKVTAVLGNGLRADIWDDFQQRFGIKTIAEIYGASEGNAGFMNIFNLKRTVGFSPMSYAIVKFDTDAEAPITNTQGYLQPVKKGEVGLLLTEVSANAPYDGYTNNPQASDSKLFKNVFKAGDCWFNTGDLVRHQGYRHIAFVDRVGDTFRWKSENVATSEVEARIQSLQDVFEAVVYGVKVPHTEGRAGMVSLILKKGQEFSPTQFYQHLKSQLPDYAVPLFVRLRQAHELTTTFKIKRTALQKESFQLPNISDPIFVLVDKSRGYEPLNDDLFDAIQRGQIRF